MSPQAIPFGAVIALGSNLGDTRGNVLRGLAALAKLSTKPLLQSSLWETTPVDCPPGSPRFVNAVAIISPPPSASPESLLRELQDLERQFGRQPKRVLNEARPLDLDLIAFASIRCDGPQLTLPHPRAHCRRFVLQPLTEIAPDLVLPGQQKSVLELLSLLPEDPNMKRL